MVRPIRVSNRASAQGNRGDSATKRTIIEVGSRLFAANGYDGTGVQEIVDEAGVTKGAFYHSFVSKGHLLCHIQDEFIDACLAALDATVDYQSTPQEALRGAIAAMLVISTKRRDELNIFFQERRHITEDPMFAEVLVKRERFEQHFVSLLERRRRAGEFRAVARERVVAFGIIGMCAWASQWLRAEGAAAAEVADLYTDLLLYGLLTPEFRDAAGKAKRPRIASANP